MRKIFFLLILTISVSCVSTRYNLRPDAQIETLSICISYSNNVPDTVRNSIEREITRFINKYNYEPHEFRLSFCDDVYYSSLVIDVKGTVLVSTGRQITSTLITIAGISLPFILIAADAPIYIFFYTIPNDVSNINMNLSPDLTTKFMTYNMNVANSGYLMSQEKQIRKHAVAFSTFLSGVLRQVEKEYLKSHGR
jgi:hypothetical protein